MVLINTNSDADVNIFIEEENRKYRLRYEIRKSISDDLTAKIFARLLKSYSLGRSFADANSEPAIRQKARLMSIIFKNEYGLSSTIIDLIF